ncbi:MAG: hypothetical protein E6J90_39990 [Deltaproteobacteria bacterium]|nr:MAG: hypothetical protein E6J90_39990 [Deltaproteobacteria bacterium]
MANRNDFFFRERVTEAELDSAFADLEDADHNLAADLGFVGVLANAVVSPHAPRSRTPTSLRTTTPCRPRFPVMARRRWSRSS